MMATPVIFGLRILVAALAEVARPSSSISSRAQGGRQHGGRAHTDGPVAAAFRSNFSL